MAARDGDSSANPRVLYGPFRPSRLDWLGVGFGVCLGLFGVALVAQASFGDAPASILGLALPLFAGGILLAWRSICSPSSIVFEPDLAARTLTVECRYLGLVRRRCALSLEGLESVRVEARTIRTYMQRGYQDDPGGRVVLHYSDGTRTPVLRRVLRGVRVHHEAAAALRGALGVEDAKADAVRREVDRAEASARAAAEAAAGSGPGRTVMMVFGAVTLLMVVSSAIAGWMRRNEAYLEIHAEQRCRFKGTEVPAGGAKRWTLEAGGYVVEVLDPETSTWRESAIEVKKAEITNFDCR